MEPLSAPIRELARAEKISPTKIYALIAHGSASRRKAAQLKS
jgi:hypothetical protein